ncbi:MAG: DUF2587 domain-containing protein [Actinomycetota bacterium]|nr:DUF2587 domain-containing protein [Actinomycetota bacterium]
MSDELNSKLIPISAPEGDAGDDSNSDSEESGEGISSPAKVLRVGTMAKTLLEELRTLNLDDPARARLKEIYSSSVLELKSALDKGLADELDRISLPFVTADDLTGPELIIAHAQLVGWLEGLFHGIQAMLFAQQAQARSQIEELRRRGLPSAPSEDGARPGTYL